jgi:hypothetical protein
VEAITPEEGRRRKRRRGRPAKHTYGRTHRTEAWAGRKEEKEGRGGKCTILWLYPPNPSVGKKEGGERKKRRPYHPLAVPAKPKRGHKVHGLVRKLEEAIPERRKEKEEGGRDNLTYHPLPILVEPERGHKVHGLVRKLP